ncbi:MAG TPA: 4'-phosphopantetheinyl transferase superfamily protein, partial [Cytophagaceae bacterium]|nr:4'-phosphopantetheinyl transferase superfamily protein [Cytophagaceae bacterium]
KIEKVKHKFLSIAEKETFDTQYLMYNIQFLILAWSVKEAIYKWYGDGEVDFREHIHIEDIFLNGEEGIVYCSFLKDAAIKLEVHFIFFEDNCLAWLVGNFN